MLTGIDGGTISTFGVPAIIAIGVKSLIASYGSLRTAGLVPWVPTYPIIKRVAIGRGARGGQRSDDAPTAALIVDDDRHAKREAEPIGDGARDQVDTAARLYRRDDLDRPVRIVGWLGLAERGHARQGDRDQGKQPDRAQHS